MSFAYPTTLWLLTPGMIWSVRHSWCLCCLTQSRADLNCHIANQLDKSSNFISRQVSRADPSVLSRNSSYRQGTPLDSGAPQLTEVLLQGHLQHTTAQVLWGYYTNHHWRWVPGERVEGEWGWKDSSRHIKVTGARSGPYPALHGRVKGSGG